MKLTLTLNQSTTGGITGEADINVEGTDIHLTITGGAVTNDGKISVEASREGFSTVHLSLDGTASRKQIVTKMNFQAGTFLGSVEEKGTVTLTPVG